VLGKKELLYDLSHESATIAGMFLTMPQPAGLHTACPLLTSRCCHLCRHWHDQMSGPHIVCRFEGGVLVVARKSKGWAVWEREVGADDS